MTVTTIAGAITALRSQVKGQAGTLPSTAAKNRVAAAVDQFQNELLALNFPMTGADNPAAVSLSDALAEMRVQIAAQSSMSVYSRLTAIVKLDQLTAELSSAGVAVGS
jgi:hypothetical protein